MLIKNSLSVLDEMFNRRLIINIGKGGVGRSTLSAFIALLAAEMGKRVLICEVNAKDRMPELFNTKRPPKIKELDKVWQIKKNIWTVNINPRDGMKEYIVRILKLKLVYNLLFENRMARQFLQGVPGLQELVFIGKIWYHAENEPHRFDLVIVDSPATGHGLAMLRIPSVILKISPPGLMLSEAKKIHSFLSSPNLTWINIVTLPEELPAKESIELHRKLISELQLKTSALFLNQWPKNRYTDEEFQLLSQISRLQSAGDEKLHLLRTLALKEKTSLQRAASIFRELRLNIQVPMLQFPPIVDKNSLHCRESNLLAKLVKLYNSGEIEELSPDGIV